MSQTTLFFAEHENLDFLVSLKILHRGINQQIIEVTHIYDHPSRSYSNHVTVTVVIVTDWYVCMPQTQLRRTITVPSTNCNQLTPRIVFFNPWIFVPYHIMVFYCIKICYSCKTTLHSEYQHRIVQFGRY
jgi:hypothetical protein